MLGPLVYGVAYCPLVYKERMEKLGFADSKTLTAAIRSDLLGILQSDPDNLGWSVRVVSPQAISSGMLRKPPTNLNRQSEEATILLIKEVIAAGIELSEVYVDALGNTTTYEAYLSRQFPGINFTVTNKADSKFKIVGAASVAAKVTRDVCIEEWVFEEDIYNANKLKVALKAETEGGNGGSKWSSAMGSGYPSDPNTQAWLKSSLDPIFGFPKVVRFSWTTVKVLMEGKGHSVKWIDEGQASLIKAFESGKGIDKGRTLVARDLQLFSVVDL